MAATIRNPWKNATTSREQYARKVAQLEAEIANAQRTLDWQLSEGYEIQAEYSRTAIAKLQAKLAKLEGE